MSRVPHPLRHCAPIYEPVMQEARKDRHAREAAAGEPAAFAAEYRNFPADAVT